MPLKRLGVPLSGVTRTGDTADGYRVMSARRLSHAHNPLSFLELALVTAVLGVAAAVAVPEFLHLRQGANDDAAKSRLTQAVRTLELRHSTAGTFAGATLPSGLRLHAVGRGSFCVETTAGGHIWHASRNAKPASGACP